MAKKRRKRRVGISDRAPEASRRPRALPPVTEALPERFLEARGSLRTPFWRPKREVPTLTKAWPQRIGSTFSGFQRGSRKKKRKTTKIQVEITAFGGRNGSRRASQTSPVRPRGPKMASGGGPGTHPKIDEFSGNGKVRKKAVRRLRTEGYGGLAEAAGKVRKGKPSGPGRHTHRFRTTPAPRRGTANLNRCARSPYTRGNPGE